MPDQPSDLERVRLFIIDASSLKFKAEALTALDRIEAELEGLRKELREIHNYNCGCDEPGRLDRCVAQPVVLFAALQASEPAGERS